MGAVPDWPVLRPAGAGRQGRHRAALYLQPVPVGARRRPEGSAGPGNDIPRHGLLGGRLGHGGGGHSRGPGLHLLERQRHRRQVRLLRLCQEKPLHRLPGELERPDRLLPAEGPVCRRSAGDRTLRHPADRDDRYGLHVPGPGPADRQVGAADQSPGDRERWLLSGLGWHAGAPWADHPHRGQRPGRPPHWRAPALVHAQHPGAGCRRDGVPGRHHHTDHADRQGDFPGDQVGRLSADMGQHRHYLGQRQHYPRHHRLSC